MDDHFFDGAFPQSVHEAESSPVLLFGPQVTHWTQPDVSALQHALQNDPTHGFLRAGLERLEQLESLFANIEDTDELCRGAHVQRDLSLLKDVASGDCTFEPHSMSNIVRAPLTVAMHIHHLLRGSKSLDATGTKSIKQVTSCQGFCIGFLTSAALSLSKSASEFEQNVHIALRLATLIGMIVDAEDLAHADSDVARVIAARCKGPSDRKQLDKTLDLFPNVRFQNTRK